MKRILLSLLAYGMFTSTFAQSQNLDKWVITPAPTMKGVLGKLNMNFPAGLDWNIGNLAITHLPDNKYITSFTGNTVTEYIQRVKIEAAKKSFETSRKNISEVMYDVGYSDTKAFRGTFKKITAMSPIDYRNKYNKEAGVYI